MYHPIKISIPPTAITQPQIGIITVITIPIPMEIATSPMLNFLNFFFLVKGHYPPLIIPLLLYDSHIKLLP